MRTILLLTAAMCLQAPPAAAQSGRATQQAADLAGRSLGRFSLRGVPAEQAVEMLRDRSEALIVVDWDSLRANGVRPDSAVRIVGDDLTLSEALYQLSGSLDDGEEPTSWLLFDEAFVVTTQSNVLAIMRNPRVGVLPAMPAAPRRVTTGRPVPTPRGPATQPAQPARPSPTGSGRIQSLQLEDVALEDAIEFFRNVGQISIVVNWRALESVGLDRRTPVSVQARDVRLGKAMDLVFGQLNAGRDVYDSIYWDVDEGVVSVTTGTELDREFRVEVYDVSDLLMAPPDFPGRDLDLNDSNSGGSGYGSSGSGSGSGIGGSLFDDEEDDDEEDEYDQAEMREQLRAQLIDLVRASTGEELWEPIGRGSIRIFQGRMIISQSRLGFKLMDRNLGRR